MISRISILLAWLLPAAVAMSASGEERPAPLVVQARLIEATPVPALEAIAPYDSALVVHTYRVVHVVSGDLTDRDISVAHWAIQERENLAVPATTNETVRLTLIPYHVCSELRGEKVVDTTGGFDLLYFFARAWCCPIEGDQIDR